MYLKCIEMHGFKSFANKIVLDFHNGITGIVGPNGSGKSNVADAVRWVLGEQSAKQLRGASMQDVIFAGTENRKSLSYAYVAITMDNSDHVLPVDFEEVTIARRVYRSGESEYLLNGTTCRLRDVNELFYDTGIGKEGYSIIGQGQIEKILSGKPEDRRELFDEAVGIVKYKKRKLAAQKKLQDEEENLVRVNDILNELETRVGPLEEQAKVARAFLELKERQKKLDVNLFISDMTQLEQDKESNSQKSQIAVSQLEDVRTENEQLKIKYTALEEKLSGVDAGLERIREAQQQCSLNKSRLENEILLLQEQIRSSRSTKEAYQQQDKELQSEIAADEKAITDYESNKNSLQKQLDQSAQGLKKARDYYQGIRDEIDRCQKGIEENNSRLLALMEEREGVSSEEERFKALKEQLSIRRAGINKRLLARKTEADLAAQKHQKANEAYNKAKEDLVILREEKKKLDHQAGEWQQKHNEASGQLAAIENEIVRIQSRYESMRNIAERYEGYGNAVKRVMEQKRSEPGLVGVVADLIHVDQKYETAMETALGGSIQNVVTEDEDTAKRMITFLKKTHAGRVTFLPLTSVDGRRNQKKLDVMREPGVMGTAAELLEYDQRFEGIISYLVGRIVVVDTIDAAVALAKKTRYSLHIVTLEGEYLRPGGSLSGGAYKNAGNLLSRNRQLEDLEKRLEKNTEKKKSIQSGLDKILKAKSLVEAEKKENDKKIQDAVLAVNTAKMELDLTNTQLEKSQSVDISIQDESRSIESELLNIRSQTEENTRRLTEIRETQKVLQDDTADLQKIHDEQTYMETTAARNVSEFEMEEAAANQQMTFLEDNLKRTIEQLEKHRQARERLKLEVVHSESDVTKKLSEIETIKSDIRKETETALRLEQERQDASTSKEALEQEKKGFFDRREEVSDQINRLEKEVYRLDTIQEKIQEKIHGKSNYMWEEYELTMHAAIDLRDDSLTDPEAMRKELGSIRDEIRSMGTVNVNAIADYAETKERYDHLKTQHDDIVDAQDKLSGIIEELDEGMRRQFESGFKDIQREFDSAFKELFGGGRGTLELLPDEDILETGIRIVAQPPGKKLQNMMQLSGGEKSLTAISLLFAIQNLKPSPFCLLDEIEAALDDSNVDRFAKYLHKLTRNTQFIVITHRRGTMNSADRLYGITMQEKGISTLVSVNLVENELDE